MSATNGITSVQDAFVRKVDPWLVFYPREKRNLCQSPVHGIGSAPDARWENVRANMGYIRTYP